MRSAIYFGVDGDWWTGDDQGKVAKYFEGINERFAVHGNPFRIGVYGSGTTCVNLRDHNLAELFWLPLSTGWSGTRDFYNSLNWHFYQNFHGLTLGGRYTDTNIVNPAVSDIGTFDRAGPVANIAQQPSVFQSRRFVGADNVKLHAGPTPESTQLATLRRRRNVRLLGEQGAWSEIDTDEDGSRDGFCLSEALVDFSRMP